MFSDAEREAILGRKDTKDNATVTQLRCVLRQIEREIAYTDGAGRLPSKRRDRIIGILRSAYVHKRTS